MPNASEKARVIQPETAVIEGNEISRIGVLNVAEMAALRKRLYGGLSGVFSGLLASVTGTNRVVSVSSGDGIDGDGKPVVVPSVIPTGGHTPSVTISNGDATHDRIDVVYLQAAEIDGDITSTPTKANRTAAIANQDLAHSKLQHFTIGVVEGTPAASPTVPAIPSGAVYVADVYVAAGSSGALVSGDLTDRRNLLPYLQAPGPSTYRLSCIGSLAAIVGLDVADSAQVPANFSISGIAVHCPRTGDSGTIEIDILLQTSPGATPVSLYSLQPRPTLTCDGNAQWATFIDPDLPDTVGLPAGSRLILQIIQAPGGSEDLTVEIY